MNKNSYLLLNVLGSGEPCKVAVSASVFFEYLDKLPAGLSVEVVKVLDKKDFNRCLDCPIRCFDFVIRK